MSGWGYRTPTIWTGLASRDSRNWLRCLSVGTMQPVSNRLPATCLKYANPQEQDYATPLISSQRRNDEFVDSVEQPTVQANLTKRYTEAAVEFIKRNRQRPFFGLFAPYRRRIRHSSAVLILWAKVSVAATATW